MDQCPECGFSYDLSQASVAGWAIGQEAANVMAILRGEPVGLRTRPRPEVWSPLEYACHLRDVLFVQRERVLAARRTAARPPFTPMGRDERVEHEGYAEQEPDDVARQLGDAALMFANVLDRLGPDDWARHVVYNYPQPCDRTLQWVAVHTLHEMRHHLLDIRRQIAPASTSNLSRSVSDSTED